MKGWIKRWKDERLNNEMEGWKDERLNKEMKGRKVK